MIIQNPSQQRLAIVDLLLKVGALRSTGLHMRLAQLPFQKRVELSPLVLVEFE